VTECVINDVLGYAENRTCEFDCTDTAELGSTFVPNRMLRELSSLSPLSWTKRILQDFQTVDMNNIPMNQTETTDTTADGEPVMIDESVNEVPTNETETVSTDINTNLDDQSTNQTEVNTADGVNQGMIDMNDQGDETAGFGQPQEPTEDGYTQPEDGYGNEGNMPPPSNEGMTNNGNGGGFGQTGNVNDQNDNGETAETEDNGYGRPNNGMYGQPDNSEEGEMENVAPDESTLPIQEDQNSAEGVEGQTNTTEVGDVDRDDGEHEQQNGFGSFGQDTDASFAGQGNGQNQNQTQTQGEDVDQPWDRDQNQGQGRDQNQGQGWGQDQNPDRNWDQQQQDDNDEDDDDGRDNNEQGGGGGANNGNGDRIRLLAACYRMIPGLTGERTAEELGEKVDFFECLLTSTFRIIEGNAPRFIDDDGSDDDDDDDDDDDNENEYRDRGERILDRLFPRCSRGRTIPQIVDCIARTSPTQCFNETLANEIEICLEQELFFNVSNTTELDTTESNNQTNSQRRDSNRWNQNQGRNGIKKRRIEAIDVCTSTIEPCVNETIQDRLENDVDRCLRNTTRALARCGRDNRLECRDRCMMSSSNNSDSSTSLNPFSVEMVESCSGIQDNIVTPSCDRVSCCPACLDELEALNECVVNNVLNISFANNNQTDGESCDLTCTSPVDMNITNISNNSNNETMIQRQSSVGGNRYLQSSNNDISDNLSDEQTEAIYNACAIATPGVTGQSSSVDELVNRAVFFDCIIEELFVVIEANNDNENNDASSTESDTAIGTTDNTTSGGASIHMSSSSLFGLFIVIARISLWF
jgi:hypothetical protein